MIPLKITIAQTDFRDFEEMARRSDLDVVYNFPRFFIILLLIAALGSLSIGRLILSSILLHCRGLSHTNSNILFADSTLSLSRKHLQYLTWHAMMLFCYDTWKVLIFSSDYSLLWFKCAYLLAEKAQIAVYSLFILIGTLIKHIKHKILLLPRACRSGNN